jgi:uncharacterized membrane protein YeaQ/YmgE (transglycosylase-associated protein family)
MGLFSDDEPEKLATNTQNHPGFIGALILMLVGGLLAMLSWIFKPFFTWLFDFREHGKVKGVIVAVLFGTVLLFIYRIPAVRDAISLSKTHTHNTSSENQRIPFPDRSYFVVEGTSRLLRDQSIVFVTYDGYNERLAREAVRNSCHLVPRSEKLLFASHTFPSQAEGFEDSVTYVVKKPLSEVYGWRYWLHNIANPSYLFKRRESLSNITIAYTEDGTWYNLKSDWEYVRTFPTGEKGFTVKALNSEHAMACF